MWDHGPGRLPITIWRRERGGEEYCAHAAQGAEPCYIESNGKAVAVLVSLRQWQQWAQSNGDAVTAAKAQERRVRAYQKRLQQLGPDYWLPPDQQMRLKELVEKEDSGTSLTPA